MATKISATTKRLRATAKALGIRVTKKVGSKRKHKTDRELASQIKRTKSKSRKKVKQTKVKNPNTVKDAGRQAKKPGRRKSKKGHKNQYGETKGGNTYYESRENRSDIGKWL